MSGLVLMIVCRKRKDKINRKILPPNRILHKFERTLTAGSGWLKENSSIQWTTQLVSLVPRQRMPDCGMQNSRLFQNNNFFWKTLGYQKSNTLKPWETQEPSFSQDAQQTYSNQSATQTLNTDVSSQSPIECFGPRRGHLRIGLPRTKHQSVILHLLHV